MTAVIRRRKAFITEAKAFKMLHGVIGYAAYASLVCDQQRSVELTQQKYMFDCYHGVKDVRVSKIHEVMRSTEGRFSNLWEERCMGGTQMKRMLKPEFTGDVGIGEDTFSIAMLGRTSLNSKKPQKLDGKKLLALGKRVDKDLKKW